MARHAENCTGVDSADGENGTPPKRARGGRKRKMRSRKDDDDDDDSDEHGEPDLDDIDEEEEDDLLDDEQMDVEQAPPSVPMPAPAEPPVKRKRGRPPKNAPKPSPTKSIAKTTTAAAIIQVEDESTGAIENIIVKKEPEGSDATVTAQPVVEEVEAVEAGVETVQIAVPEAAPNGDLTPEMILSMMDR